MSTKKTKKDKSKKVQSDKRKEKEIKTEIFEEEYKYQWRNRH